MLSLLMFLVGDATTCSVMGCILLEGGRSAEDYFPPEWTAAIDVAWRVLCSPGGSNNGGSSSRDRYPSKLPIYWVG